MSVLIPVRIVGSAARSIAEAAAWWTENRPKAPDAFVDDLEHTLTLIASHPDIGARARNSRLENVRRVHLARVHYYLYYQVTSGPSIEVLALWHTSRGSDPKL
jgi:plasmid stabilization system protein ParE